MRSPSVLIIEDEPALLRDGRVLAHGPTTEVLTPANVRAVYDVEADVQPHPAAGHLVVVPVAKAASR